MSFVPTTLAATPEADAAVSSIPGFLMNIAISAVAILITFFIATLLKMWVQRMISKKKAVQHEEMRILYGRVVFTAAMAIGITISLTIVGAPLEWFTGGIGLGIAFAFRGILANFFAGMMLLSNNKFNIGDFVMLDPNKDGSSDISGTIVDIQSRATSLRDVDGGEITVPNMRMIESAVKCFTKNPIRRIAIRVGVGFHTNIKEASQLIKEAISSNKDVQPEPPVSILTEEISDSAIVLEGRFWVESTAKWWLTKSDITHNVFNALTEAGIDIPYPIQTLRVDEDSSGLLAKNPHLLENLEHIEHAKHEGKKPIFQKTPVETAEAPAAKPAPVVEQKPAAAPAPQAQSSTPTPTK